MKLYLRDFAEVTIHLSLLLVAANTEQVNFN